MSGGGNGDGRDADDGDRMAQAAFDWRKALVESVKARVAQRRAVQAVRG